MSTHFFLGICFTLSLRIDTRIQARKRLRNHSVMQFEYEGAPNKQLGSKSMIPSDLRGTECARVFALLGMHKNSSSEAWSKIRSTSKGKAKTSSLSKLTFLYVPGPCDPTHKCAHKQVHANKCWERCQKQGHACCKNPPSGGRYVLCICTGSRCKSCLRVEVKQGALRTCVMQSHSLFVMLFLSKPRILQKRRDLLKRNTHNTSWCTNTSCMNPPCPVRLEILRP